MIRNFNIQHLLLIFNCFFYVRIFQIQSRVYVYRIGNTELLNVICVVLRLHLGIFSVNVHSREKLSVIFYYIIICNYNKVNNNMNTCLLIFMILFDS